MENIELAHERARRGKRYYGWFKWADTQNLQRKYNWRNQP